MPTSEELSKILFQVVPPYADVKASAKRYMQKRREAREAGQDPPRPKPKLCVGFTERGGQFWESCTAIDWNEFYSLHVNEETQIIVVELCSPNAVTAFDGERPWKGKLVNDVELVAFRHPFYWRTFENPRQLTYELSLGEIEEFLRTFPWRSNIPLCGVWPGEPWRDVLM